MLAAEPLRFEPNHGQVPGVVAFVAHGHGYIAYITLAGLALSLQSSAPHGPSGDGSDAAGDSFRRAVVWLRFAGANPRPTITGLHRLPGTSNYFIGNDPRQWHTAVPAFGEIAYHGIYPGVDAIFYDNGHGLEYDLRLAPGADPNAIRLAVTGGQTISAMNGLIVHTDAGDMRLGAPRIYQRSGRQRLPVAGRYQIRQGGAIGFAVGMYDRARPLIIDPTVVYSTYLGGTGDDLGNGIAVDGQGHAFIAGETTSLDFPAATNGARPDFAGGGSCEDYYTCGDAFVAKLSADGRGLLYRTYLGGSRNDGAWTVAIDDTGNAYIEGRTLSLDFPVKHAFQPRLARGNGDNVGDAFVAKLSADGTKLLYSTYLGGTGNDQALGIAVDSQRHAFVTGYTSSRDFPLAHAFQGNNKSARGSVTVFVSKLSADGRALLYSTYLGGSDYESAGAIAVDRRGDAYITGSTQSRDFPLANTLQHFSAGHLNGFVAALNAGGSKLLFSTYLGGSAETIGTSIALDGAGQMYVAGSTAANDFPIRRAIQKRAAGIGALGWGDAFVAKFSAGGKSLLVSTYLGGKGDEQALGLALDGRGNVFVTGATTSENFPTLRAIQPANHTARSCRERLPYDPVRRGYHPFAFPCADAFITELGNGGTALRYSTYLGGALGDGADFVATDKAGNAYVVGTTRSPNFPLFHAMQPGFGGGAGDVFVAKIAG